LSRETLRRGRFIFDGFHLLMSRSKASSYILPSLLIGRGPTLIPRRILELVLIAAIIGLGLVGALAYTVEPATADTPLVAEKIVGDLELSMAIQKSNFNVGEPVNITFTVTNIGVQTINYTHSEPEFDFIVSNSSNQNLYQWTSFKAFPMLVLITQLDPGHNYTSILTWPQTCNQTIYNNEGVPVSPGQYSITGVFIHFATRIDPMQVNIGSVNARTAKPVSVVFALVGLGIVVPVASMLVAALVNKKYW
jgi:hypothetical protein